MPTLRLLADDLTGALDSAAAFVGWCGPLSVAWDAAPPRAGTSLALDSGTRELPRDEATAAVAKLAPMLAGGDIAFKKIDSLLRGSWAAELAACRLDGPFDHVVLAPAFPDQGRRTRNGRQETRGLDGTWRPVGDDLVAELGREGIAATRAAPGDELPKGVAVFDASSDPELDAVVAAGRQGGGRVLWCGTGGLALALARQHPTAASSRLAPPILGLFGSDQAVTATQLAACGNGWVRIEAGREAADGVAGHLARHRVAMVSLDLPAGLARPGAAGLIADTFRQLTVRLPPPATLLVAGGETLKGLCASLGATSLRVTGQVAPGLPRSVVAGGRWDGVEVVSKSGAFGPPGLWRDLLRENGLADGTAEERIRA